MECAEIMKDHVTCLETDDTVYEAARKMQEANVGFLPICDKAGKPVGTLTDRDITVRVVAEDNNPQEVKVSKVMTSQPVTCQVHEDIQAAEDQMCRCHVSRVMCVDDQGKLAGVISLADIAQCEEGARSAEVLRKVSAREARL